MFQPNGYDVVRADRTVSRGGGVLLLYKNHLKVENVEFVDNNIDMCSFEFLCVDIYTKVCTFRFICFYVPPCSSCSNTVISNVCKIIRKLLTDTKPCYILGDFNLPNINWEIFSTGGDLSHKTFLDFCISNDLSQNIKVATHIKGNILDILLSNTPGNHKLLSSSVNHPLSSTCDHYLITFDIQSYLTNNFNNSSKYPNFTKGNFELICNDLNLIDWMDIFQNSFSLQNFYDIFLSKLDSVITKHVPLKSSATNRRRQRPKFLQVLLQEKIAIYRRFKNDRSLASEVKLKNKEYEVAVNKWYDDSEKKLCENPSARNFYNYVNGKMKSRHSIPVMRDCNNNVVETDLAKANLFNKYFQKVFVLDDGRPLCSSFKTSTMMNPFTISHNDIIEAVNGMKDKISRTPEGIPIYLIRRIIPSILHTLSLIFNVSFNQNVIPSQWKNAIIIPVYKRGNRNTAKNYRPISLTSSFCRIFESVVVKNILEHLITNELISPRQFGFLPSRSSCSQLLQCMYKWSSAFSQNLTTNVVYTDISKAFDSVVHSKLIHCLTTYGLDRQLIDWFTNFLSGRSQQVAINNRLSDPLPIYSGVPQGSIVGPILFLIYFNNVTNSCNFLNDTVDIFLFADDTKLSSTNCAMLQTSLDYMDEWLQTHQLKLAYEKCFLMQVSKRRISQDPSFTINDQTISSVLSFKDLGVFIQADLKWSEHVNYIYRKAATTSYQLLKAFNTKNIWTLRKLFITYVRPKCEYNSPVWSPSLIKDIAKIERVQRSFTRSIFMRAGIPFSSYEDRIQKLNLLSLQDRRTLTDLILIYKIYYGQSDLNFNDFFVLRTRPYVLRGHSIQINPKLSFITTQFQSTFFYRATKYWNSLPEEIVISPTVNIFKSKLLKFDLKTLL